MEEKDPFYELAKFFGYNKEDLLNVYLSTVVNQEKISVINSLILQLLLIEKKAIGAKKISVKFDFDTGMSKGLFQYTFK